MKLSTLLRYAGSPREAADAVVGLEAAGLDRVWVPEVYGSDSPTLMGYLAARTSRVEIGSAILNVYSRTPALIAQTAAGLDDVSGGRALLGLGASGPQVVEGWHGVPYDRPLARTREVVEIVRAALRRETLRHDGAVFTLPLPPDQGLGLGKPLKLLTRPVRREVPIWLAALGPRSVRAAATYADGWLPFLFAPERADRVWGASLRAGLAERDPALGPLQIAAGGIVAIGDDVRDRLDLARPTAALYIGGMGARGKNFYHDLVASYGFGAEADRIQDLYLSGRHRDAEAAVPRELLEMTNLVGPASAVRERIAAYAEARVTDLQVMPVGDDPAGTLRQLREWLP